MTACPHYGPGHDRSAGKLRHAGIGFSNAQILIARIVKKIKIRIQTIIFNSKAWTLSTWIPNNKLCFNTGL